MKQHMSSILIRIEIFLIGIFFCGVALFAVQFGIDDGAGWGSSRIGLLLGGMFALLVSGVVTLPRANEFISLARITSFGIYINKAFGWSILAFLGVEILLRMTIYSPSLEMVTTNFFGEVPAENSLLFWGKEGFGWTHYNKFGEIDTPFQGTKPVLLVGDSFSEGWQVSDQNKFASVAEMNLHRWDKEIDVHNFGRSSMSMADYVSFIPIYKTLYSPEAIVVQLTSDDFVESFTKTKLNYFVQKDGKIYNLIHMTDISAKKLDSSNEHVNSTSMVINLAKEKIKLNKSSNNSINEPAMKFDILLAQQQLDELVKVCDGIPLILVLLPNSPTISGDQINFEDPDYQNLLKLVSGYPEITVVDPYADFTKLADNNLLPHGFYNSTIPGTGHLNVQGNEIVGRLLAQAVEKVLQ